MARTETVTVVFTDLVGSTELASRLGHDAYEAPRHEHFAALRTAVTKHGGSEVERSHPASPRKIIMARLRRSRSSSASLPIRVPNFSFGTVVILSTISREVVASPLVALGSTAMRNSGASVGSVVKAQIVIELVAPNRSSCTITIGRGLPA